MPVWDEIMNISESCLYLTRLRSAWRACLRQCPMCMPEHHVNFKRVTTVTPTSAIMGAGLGNDVALITDGRFSGGSHGMGTPSPPANV